MVFFTNDYLKSEQNVIKTWNNLNMLKRKEKEKHNHNYKRLFGSNKCD